MSEYTTVYEKSFVQVAGIDSGVVIPVANGSKDRLAFTSTLLPAGNTYESAAFDSSEYEHAVGTCYASHDGILYIECSPDGTNWDGQDAIAYTALDKLEYKALVTEIYLRARFTNNGAVIQTAFRLSLNGQY